MSTDASNTRELERLKVALAECEMQLERERRFGHSVTDATTSLLLLVDSAGTIVPGGVNVAVERLSGRSEEELVGRRFEGADPASWLGSDQPPAFESPFVTRAGERRDIEWTEARAELAEALAELRELAHGLRPAVLSTHGLGVALEGIANRATIPVDVSVELTERPSAALEAAAYYIVAEAVTNAQKHSRATTVHVNVTHTDGLLQLDVSDNGIGGASMDGSGLVGLEDRVEVLGGSLEVTSPPGHGTQITARIPLESSLLAR